MRNISAILLIILTGCDAKRFEIQPEGPVTVNIYVKMCIPSTELMADLEELKNE